ncbi:MAG: hypothetical protein ACI4J7_13320 [Ruminiclostridium sp.]
MEKNIQEMPERTTLSDNNISKKFAMELLLYGLGGSLDSEQAIRRFRGFSENLKLELFLRTSKIEKEGLNDYVKQFLKFINGYSVGELPYITTAVRMVAQILLAECKRYGVLEHAENVYEQYGKSGYVFATGIVPDNKDE